MINKDNYYSLLWGKFINEGDLESLSLIYLDLYDLLFNYGFKYTKDIATIEDSIQNVYGYFLKTRQNLNLSKNVRGYIIQCFRRQLFLDIKKQKKTNSTVYISEDSFNYYNSPEQDIINKERQDNVKIVIRECIRNLSARQQEMIYLHFVFDLAYEDISNMLGISVDSCYKTVYRALRLIRIKTEKILDKG